MRAGGVTRSLSEGRESRGGEKESAEEKEKIVAKEEAESLMIFLITAARTRKERKIEREGEEEGEKNEERNRENRGGNGRGDVEERACSTLPCQPRIHPNWLVLPPPAFNPVAAAASRIKSIDLSFFLWPVRLTSREG